MSGFNYSKSELCPSGRGSGIGDFDALVLAGGQGTRMRKLLLKSQIANTKITLPIDTSNGHQPMITHALDGLHSAGVRTTFALTSAHRDSGGDQVEKIIEDWSANIHGTKSVGILREPLPLGTGGAVFNAILNIPEISNNLIITPSDTLFPYKQLVDLAQVHLDSGVAVTWAVTSDPGPEAQNSGLLLVNEETGFLEHSLENNPGSSPEDLMYASTRLLTSVGVMAVNGEAYREAYTFASAFTDFPERVDLYRDMMPWLLGCGIPILTYDIECPAPDLGTPERYLNHSVVNSAPLQKA